MVCELDLNKAVMKEKDYGLGTIIYTCLKMIKVTLSSCGDYLGIRENVQLA